MHQSETKLVKYVLASSFVANSNDLIKTAMFRITTTFVGIFATAYYLSKALVGLDLPKGLPIDLALCLALLTGFVLSGILLITVLNTKLSSSTKSLWARIIHLLPVSSRARWLCEVLPVMVVCGGLFLLCFTLLVTLTKQMQLPLIQLSVGLLIGILSAAGLFLLVGIKPVIKSVLFCLLVIAGVWLLDLSLKNESAQTASNLLKLVMLLLGFPIIGLIQNFYKGYAIPSVNNRFFVKPWLPNYFPVSWWLVVKLLRNSRVRNSLIIAFGLNLILSIIMSVKKIAITDPVGILSVGGVLATSFGCEVRGVTRKQKAPEILQYKSVTVFALSEILVTLAAGIFIGMPLFFTLNSASGNSVTFLEYFLCLQILCSTLGLMISTIFVPKEGEVGVQFIVALLSMGLFFGYQKYVEFYDVSDVSQITKWSLTIIAIVVQILIIEKKRRRNYGRIN